MNYDLSEDDYDFHYHNLYEEGLEEHDRLTYTPPLNLGIISRHLNKPADVVNDTPEPNRTSHVSTLSPRPDIRQPSVSGETSAVTVPSVDSSLSSEAMQWEDSAPEAGVNPRSGKFSLQNQRIHLTYKTHIPKKELADYIREETGCSAATIDIAHESADTKAPYEHTHVVIDFHSRYQTTNQRKFDYQGIHPHIKKINSHKHYENCLTYLAKEDPENAHLKDPKKTVLQHVLESTTIHEALRRCVKRPSDVAGVVQLYNLKGPNYDHITVPPPIHPWQKEIIDYTSEPCPQHLIRKVIWIYDPAGNTGKSQLCRFLTVTSTSKWYVLNGISSTRDVSTIILGAVESGWTGHGIIIDIPRSESIREMSSRRDFRELYVSIESLKNGTLTATKYTGRTFFYNCSWLVVMSNWLPDINSLSLDRWDVRYLDPTTYTMTPMSIDEVRNLRQHDQSAADLNRGSSSIAIPSPEMPTNSALIPIN